jgi:nucleoside-diphosphate-sugar epimerase
MNTFFATGLTGTIGRHLDPSAIAVPIDLAADSFGFSEITFPKDANLLHLAGIVGVKEVEKDVQLASRINVEGTKLLAEQFIRHSNGKFYYVSTSHVYDISDQPIVESFKLNPASIYAEQKLEAEQELQKIFSGEPERLCILRVFSVLDWDVAPFTLGGAIKRLAKGEIDFALKNTDDIRDFLTPSTIASALGMVVFSNKLNGVVNLASGVGTSVAQAAKRMLMEAGYELKPEALKQGNSSIPTLIADNSRLASIFPELELIWKPSRAPRFN